MGLVTYKQLAEHNNSGSCWIAVGDTVYDVTQFIHTHPGGAKIILKEAGKDATSAFEAVHSVELLPRFDETVKPVGTLDKSSERLDSNDSSTAEADAAALRRAGMPSLGSVLNSFDFEAIARQTMKPEAWAYYSSGAEDEITLRENHAAFHRIALKPRVLVNVSHIDTSTTFLKQTRVSLPVYITACALGKLGHPDGETVLTRAAGTRNVVQMMPTLASCSLDDMLNARVDGQDTWFQLYVNADRNVTRDVVLKAEARGCKGLFVTVDAPQLGRREKDMRLKYQEDISDIIVKTGGDEEGESSTSTGQKKVNRAMGAARAISSFIDPSLSWKDIEWLQTVTRMPIVLKGVQTGADAVQAAKLGLAGVVVSNHGGRQLDTCRSGIEILPDVVADLKRAGLHGKMEIYVDGGFRRGSDVFKAIALGATGVGIGRPSLYAMSTYGQEGVERLLDIFREELEMVMGLMGCTKISDITEDMVDASHLSTRVSLVRDMLHQTVYEPLQPPQFNRSSKL
ncbi:hypothetical protein HDU77_005928 [Chytriomyces hyalinus]|nr:hypothetical protein HDU77_005928 [Chytriomyces hyalinus]